VWSGSIAHAAVAICRAIRSTLLVCWPGGPWQRPGRAVPPCRWQPPASWHEPLVLPPWPARPTARQLGAWAVTRMVCAISATTPAACAAFCHAADVPTACAFATAFSVNPTQVLASSGSAGRSPALLSAGPVSPLLAGACAGVFSTLTGAVASEVSAATVKATGAGAGGGEGEGWVRSAHAAPSQYRTAEGSSGSGYHPAGADAL
jgi:hypothetical protein